MDGGWRRKEKMKGNARFAIVLLAALALLLALTGCTTSIALRTLVPAEINVSGYKTIAVQSTAYNYSPSDLWWRNLFIPIKGNVEERYIGNLTKFSLFDASTSTNVAKYASENLVKAIDKGYFNVKSPNLTDALVTVGKSLGTVRQTLLNNGVDALLVSTISYMNYDEYIESVPVYSNDNTNTIVGYRFYLNQSATISLTYSMIDVEDNVVVGNDTLTRSSGPIVTLIGHTNDAKEYVSDIDYFELESASEMFDDLVDGFVDDITRKLTPHYETSYFEIMENKPKVDSLKAAYDYVDNENYRTALDLFVAEYNTSGHVASGYNAAILYYVLGQYEDAFNMASDVYNKSGNAQALDLYYRLKSVREKQEAASEQINSTQKSSSSSQTELIGF